MGVNKKVRNARRTVVDGIKFKSGIEALCYQRLVNNGFYPEYENKRFVLFEGFKLRNNLHVFAPKSLKRSRAHELMEEYTKSILPITYTPDFYLNVNGKNVFIEVKGKPNDVYPLKRKMYLCAMNEGTDEAYFFEPHNEAQINQLIKILNEL